MTGYWSGLRPAVCSPAWPLRSARRLSIPTWLVRVVFVILAFSGGVGFVAYAAGWLLIPAEGDARPAAERLLGRIEGPRAWIGVGLVVLAVLVAVESTGLIDTDLALAALLILVGVLLYRGDLGLGSTEEETTDMTTETPTDLSTTSVLDTKPGDGPGEPPAAPPEPPVPAAPTPPPIPPTPRPRSILGRVTIAVGLIVLGVMGFFDTVGGYEVAARHYLGTAVLVIGLGLLIGSVAGRARGLIVLGVILIPALLVSPLGDLDLSSEDVRYEPQTVSDIQTAYTADVGTMEIDLSNVDFAGADVSFDADLRLGQIIITVPDDISVDATASVAAGEVRVFDSVEAGLGEISTRRQIDGDNGSLKIDAEADAGQIQIRSEGQDPAPIGFRGEVVFSASDPDDLQDEYRRRRRRHDARLLGPDSGAANADRSNRRRGFGHGDPP